VDKVADCKGQCNHLKRKDESCEENDERGKDAVEEPAVAKQPRYPAGDRQQAVYHAFFMI